MFLLHFLWWLPTAAILLFTRRDAKVSGIRRKIMNDVHALNQKEMDAAKGKPDVDFMAVIRKTQARWESVHRSNWNSLAMVLKFWIPVEHWYDPKILAEIKKSA